MFQWYNFHNIIIIAMSIWFNLDYITYFNQRTIINWIFSLQIYNYSSLFGHVSSLYRFVTFLSFKHIEQYCWWNMQFWLFIGLWACLIPLVVKTEHIYDFCLIDFWSIIRLADDMFVTWIFFKQILQTRARVYN